MKTTRFIIAAVAIAAAVSCSKEGFNGEAGKESAKIVTGEMTKTSLNGKEIHWTSDDQIAVFDNAGAKNIFSITKHEGSYASFSGSVTSGTTQIYAAYPQNLAVSASGSTLKVNIPADQTSKAGSFAEEHNISVAKGTKVPGNEEIAGVVFKNVCGLLKFTVPAYVEDAQSVTFSSNSVIAGELTVDYSGDVPSVQVTGESKSVTMTGSYPAGSEFIFVLAPGTMEGFTATVATAKATWSISRDIQVVLEAGKYKNLGTLEFEQANAVSASAAHTYDNGVLTGTNVTLNLNLPEAAGKYITALDLQVKNSAGKVVRTVSKSSATATEVIGADDVWPYLPQGEYTVSGSYTLSGNTVKELGTVSFTSPAPEFTVKSNAYSSYTKYLNGDISGANACAPETIYAINSASVTISEQIRNNSNYDQGFTYVLNEVATTETTRTNCGWGSYSVKAMYYFDGVEMENTVDCSITGLPYKSGVPSNTGAHPWAKACGSLSTISWNSEYVQLSTTSTPPTVVSPTFHIPGNINVNITSKLSRNNWGTSVLSGNYRIGATYDDYAVNNRILDKNVLKKETYEGTAAGTMSPSVNKWYAQYSYGGSLAISYLYYFNISYR